ncbi:cyclohexanone monooxygenase [Leptodontidium sp. MPI-SDFR-AT-0119]|nr:cyclohexanone monooxygenase [Leptodontidium sp. MPI-SDFR-AT-0119]
MAFQAQPAYVIPDNYLSKSNRLRIIHVGAGASGLLCAYKARKMLDNYDLVCYEKNPEVGGTWWENTYPGCACDIPAHIYTYSFEPNPEWSGFYAYSDEIQSYFVRFYEKYKLQQFVRLQTTVISATWDDDRGQYSVELEKSDGTKFTDWCHVLINGSGVVNKWKWPAIDGLSEFEGKLAHSAHWDNTIDWIGKRVALIGTGSSSIQMAPHLAEGSTSLTVFARNCTWISPPIAPDSQKIEPGSEAPATASKHHYIEAEKNRFRQDKSIFLDYRKNLESEVARMFPLYLRGSDLNIAAKKNMKSSMETKLGPGREQLKAKMIPNWSPGCRRLTPGEGYLESLILPHVETIHDEIVKITPKGIMTATGREVEIDIIACATGFHVSYTPHFKIQGRDGAIMKNEWSKAPNIYLSIASPKFPNYFVMNGPRGNWAQGCALPSLEIQIEYALQCCKKLQDDGIKSMEVMQEPTTQLNDHIDLWHNNFSVFAEDCRSWYKDNKNDGRVFIWSGSLLHFLTVMQTPRYEHFKIEYWNKANMWAFLGNGRSELEVAPLRSWEKNISKRDLAPYIRNADIPWSAKFVVPEEARALS